MWIVLSIFMSHAWGDETIVLEFHHALTLDANSSSENQSSLDAFHVGQPFTLIIPEGNTESAQILLPNMAIRYGYGRGYGLHRGIYLPSSGTLLNKDVETIDGRVVFSIDQVRRDAGKKFFRYSADVMCSVERHDNGRWIGTWNDGEESGRIIGWEEPSVSGAAGTFVLDVGQSYGNTEDDPHQLWVNLLVDVDESGNPQSVDVRGARSTSTSYGTNPSQPTPVVTDDGALKFARGRLTIDAEISSFAGSYENGIWSLEVTYQSFEFDKHGSRMDESSIHTVALNWQVLGRTLVGQGTSDDQVVSVLGRRVQNVSQLQPVTLPNLTGDALSDLKTRVPLGINALADHDVLRNAANPFRCHPNSLVSSSNKQYDNAGFSGYGMVLGNLMLYRQTQDPLHLLRAMRIGHWLQMKGEGLANYYKTGVWWSAYQGQAFIDLYAATGDQVWMDAAVRYAERLRSWQLDSGAWTWYDEETGTVGKSFLRNNRDWDNRPVLMSEFLYFLGSLRQAGNSDFIDVEERGLAWHRSAISDGSMDFHMRGSAYPTGHENIQVPEGNVMGYPIMTYMRYLLEFRADVTEDELDALMSVLVNGNIIKTDGSGMVPSIIGFERRFASGVSDAPRPMTTTTAQFAVINILRQQKFGTTSGPLPHDCIAAILQVQEPDTGLLDHLGRDLPGYRPGRSDRMNIDSHPYVGLKAITIRELLYALELIQVDVQQSRTIEVRSDHAGGWHIFPSHGANQSNGEKAVFSQLDSSMDYLLSISPVIDS